MKDSDKVNLEKNRAWIEINTKNLKHNIQEISKYLNNNTKIMAVVKADAYGHGMDLIAKCLNDTGITSFAVATLEEAISLRRCGITGDILILGYTSLDNISLVTKYDLTQTIVDYDYAVKVNSSIKEKNKGSRKSKYRNEPYWRGIFKRTQDNKHL